MIKGLYLDNNATTPVDPEVLESMLPYFSENFGNAASRTHSYGWIAEEAVELAREQVADLIGSEKNEIVFTSGATESVNLAIKGVFEAYSTKGNHIITVSTEHKAVLDTCKHLENSGARITRLAVNNEGLIDPDELQKSLGKDSILVCVMLANNETGVIQNLPEISGIVHKANSLLMTDATQACGKMNVDVNELGVDLLCLSAHKIYGPKGLGALFVRRKNPRVSMIAQMDGGGHENGRRSGTLNVPGIVGLGTAAVLCKKNLSKYIAHMQSLRDRLEAGLQNEITGIHGKSPRLCNTSNVAFRGVSASSLIKKLSNIAIATGSACTSALPEPSHVLRAMGISDEEAMASVRFSTGRFNTEEEADIAIEQILIALQELRTNE